MKDEMRSEYDFSKGVRGKHAKEMLAGYTMTVHEKDGSVKVTEIAPKEGTVILEPDLRKYFPDSESVNRALRCLIPIISGAKKPKTSKA
ncbi:MAG TPA: hypothetical protein PLK28_01170 [Candidatus Rifleibacterium sp.]|nr:hypothetical protein [Candidatus Rifleibacterium sp.]